MPDIQPPPGYTLDQPAGGGGITPPPGYTLDAPSGAGQQPQGSWLAKAASSFIQPLSQASDFGQGALAGAGHTIANAWNYGVAPAARTVGVPLPNVPSPQAPNTMAGKTGYGGEQIAEYGMLGGPVNEAATGVKATLAGIRGARAANIATRAALDAGAAGTVAAAQSGGDPAATARAAATGGVVGGVGQAINEAGEAIAPWLKDSAVRAYSRTLGPTTKENKLLTERQVAPGLIQRGMTAWTRKGLQSKISATVDDVGQQVGDAIAALPADAALPEQTVMNAIDSAAQRQFTVAKPGGGTIAASPDSAAGLDMAEKLKQIVQAGRTIDTNGNPVIDSRYLRELRQNWDGMVAAGKGFTTNDLVNNAKLAAYRAASGAIRNEFAQEYPNIAVINKEYNFWKNSQKVMDATVQRTQSQATPMGEQLAQTAGAAAGFMKRGVAGAVGVAAASRGLLKLMRSPAWQTTSAVAKDRLANLILTGNGEQAASFIAELSGGVASRTPAVPMPVPMPTPYAVGGIINQPTDAVIGEVPEARIPLNGTIPEDPRTLGIQLQQLQGGQRRAVLFPRGTLAPERPDGLSQLTTRDGVLYYQPSAINPSQILSASKAGRLNDVLGAADGGMGPQSKSDIAATGQLPIAIIGKAPDGTTAQGTLASPDQVSPAIDQTAKVTPPGGSVAIERPNRELRRRMGARRMKWAKA